MRNIEKRILMYQDFEILSFEIDFEKEAIRIIKKLAHFDKAPKIILECNDSEMMSIALQRFIGRRYIPNSRTDYQEILEATGFSSGFELSFQAHGLAIFDHFWYKREGEELHYKDINFFTNKWDDSFAKAVLAQDYKALRNCDLNVPDLTTSGWGIKGWIYEVDGPKLFKLGINKDHSEEAIGEVLASRIAKRLFNEGEVLQYELRKVGDRYASVSPVIVNADEDLVPLAEYIDGKTHMLYLNINRDKDLAKEFYESIKNSNIPGLYEFFVKVACFRDLCFVSDLHFDNISLITNNKTERIRIAPLYDFGSSFGCSRTGQSFLANSNKSTALLVYYLFSSLNPDWDYTWYDPNKLIGVEDEIKEFLSKSDFYTPELIDVILQVYKTQKEDLDNMAKSNS